MEVKWRFSFFGLLAIISFSSMFSFDGDLSNLLHKKKTKNKRASR